MRKASTTPNTSRGTRIVALERGLAQLLSQLTALQTRVGRLEVAHKTRPDTLARQSGAAAELAIGVSAIKPREDAGA